MGVKKVIICYIYNYKGKTIINGGVKMKILEYLNRNSYLQSSTNCLFLKVRLIL